MSPSLSPVLSNEPIARFRPRSRSQSSITRAISVNDHSVLVTPAAIAGEVRSVLWMRTKLYQGRRFFFAQKKKPRCRPRGSPCPQPDQQLGRVVSVSAGRLRWRRRALGGHRLADRKLQAPRRRAARLSGRRHYPHRQRPPPTPSRRADALGIPAHASAAGRGLTTTLTTLDGRQSRDYQEGL